MTAVPLAITEDAARALEQLRDPSLWEWHPVFFVAVAMYIYAVEIERGRLDIVATGLAVWFADWINEILNSFVLEATGEAPLWVETGPTAYQILVGLNVETSLMFLVAGVVYARLLGPDPAARTLGMRNRLFVGVVLSVMAVVVEILLNQIGVLNWHWAFWDIPWGLPVIVVLGYLWFFLAGAWVYDAPTDAARWRKVAALAVTGVALTVLGAVAGWL